MSMVALTRPETVFSDRVMNLLEKVDYRLATTDEEKDQIYRLRYAAYLREGAIVSNFAKRLSDPYDDLDNAWTYGVFVDGHLTSSIRLSVSAADYPEFPAMKVFSDLLGPEIEAGRTIIDPTRFVVDSTFARAYPELPFVALRIGHMAAEYFDADVVLATVRTEHQAFYKRVFGHAAICEARPYPTLIKPLSLMTLDYPAERTRILRRFPFFRSTYFERRMLFGVPGMPAEWAAETGRSRGDAVTADVAALAG